MKESNWIDALKEAPNDEDRILMVDNHSNICSGKGVVFNKNIAPRDAGCGFVSAYYTHWMLLPEPPVLYN